MNDPNRNKQTESVQEVWKIEANMPHMPLETNQLRWSSSGLLMQSHTVLYFQICFTC